MAITKPWLHQTNPVSRIRRTILTFTNDSNSDLACTSKEKVSDWMSMCIWPFGYSRSRDTTTLFLTLPPHGAPKKVKSQKQLKVFWSVFVSPMCKLRLRWARLWCQSHPKSGWLDSQSRPPTNGSVSFQSWRPMARARFQMTVLFANLLPKFWLI